jgi:GAF domain-containing protein
MLDSLRNLQIGGLFHQDAETLSLPKQIARATLSRLRQLIPCRRASVALCDFQAHETVVLAVDLTGDTSLAAESRLPFAAPNLTTSRINLDTLQQEQFREIEDILSLTDPPSLLLALSAEGIRSCINAPLIAQGELIGILSLSRETPGKFSPEHQEHLRAVAASLVVALQQAQLHEQAQRNVEELCQRIAERAAALRMDPR